MLSGNIWVWIGFNVFVLAMLALDLGIFHRKAHAISIKEASIWSLVDCTGDDLQRGYLLLQWT